MNHQAPNPPWASFCVATYRRPDFLRATLSSLLQQTMPDFEVIVSDNDPDGSAQQVVQEIGDPRIRYFGNIENVGMVRNFNRALAQAHGEFVVMVSDDDPVYPPMLATLRRLAEQHPGYGAYYGACEIRAVSASVAHLYDTSVGCHPSLSAECAIGGVRLFSAAEFPAAYFANRVFPYVLWSVGAVRRSVTVGIGGMPDFGSPYFTDFGYICLACSHAGCVTVNTILGCQTVHDANFGRSGLDELRRAIQGYHDYIVARLSLRPDWDAVRPGFERFLGVWVVGHTIFMRKYFRSRGLSAAGVRQFDREAQGLFDPPYMRRHLWRYIVRANAPFVFSAYRSLRQSRCLRQLLSQK